MIRPEIELGRDPVGLGAGEGGRKGGLRNEETNRQIEQSLGYMMKHLDEPLHVAKLAALANVSPSHFFSLFKRRTGFAPIDFFIRMRMRHACRLLDETRLSVKETAAALGYDDAFYFSRVFKSVNGIAPSEYRTQSGEFKDAIRRAALRLTSLIRVEGQAVESSSAGSRNFEGVPRFKQEAGRVPSSVSEPLRTETGTDGASPKTGCHPFHERGFLLC